MSDALPQAPHFEDLRVGHLERGAPSLTLTDGMAAVHRAILGDRLRLALDHDLARRVLGADAMLAHPGLVWDVAIGQSTVLTARVIANLFYRGLVLRRSPVIGDTLHTTTEVVGLRALPAREDRPPRGLAVLRVRTVDQADRPVLDFWRCAMLPCRAQAPDGLQSGALQEIPEELPAGSLLLALDGWHLDHLASPGGVAVSQGERWRVHSGDVVSGAPELARLTLNLAAAHHDGPAQPQGRRLVYGGHTIGIAAAQAARALPGGIVTIVGWHSCDHLGPVFEGDTLRSEVELERLAPAGPVSLAHLRSRVQALRGDDSNNPTDVLDWRFVAVLA